MSAAILQLSYIDDQNMYLTKNPQITFFKTVYKRHTNFSIDTVQEYFDSGIKFGKNIRCKLAKSGDLLHRIGVYIKLSELVSAEIIDQSKNSNCLCTCPRCILNKKPEKTVYGWVNSIGHVLLESIDIIIGGQIIDRHYGEWLEIWSELSQSAEKRHGYYEMIGKKDNLSYTIDSFTSSMELYVPLNFWFCRNVGLSLPVMNLIYHDVEIIIKIRDFEKCYVCNKKEATIPKANIYAHLIVDYIYLSVIERKKFFSETHFYLIEQLQLNDNNVFDIGSKDVNVKLKFNHPVKELIWIIQRQDVIGLPDGVWKEDCSYPKGNDHFNFTSATVPRLSNCQESFFEAKLQFSGMDRTSWWPASYYRLWQNYYNHSRIPSSNNIYTYSFSLLPEEHQPSGVINMSGCNSANLSIKLNTNTKEKYLTNVKVYAVNYQMLMVTSGMASVMFFN